MEELQSTDVLDKEILEDARKKAKRILSTADETIAASAAVWEKRMGKDLGKLKKSFTVRIEKTREELMARLPLDKRRAYSEKVEALLLSSMRDYLGALSREKLLTLVEKELKRCAAGLPDPVPGAPPLLVGCRALTEEELKTLISKSLPGINWTYQKDLSFHRLPGSFPAIIVNSPAVRLTASVDAFAAALLEDSRAELVAALLGEAKDDH
ncbi:ATPase [Treponema primitia]|uniref:ATPase n=1 Tax=Treponema primitia TaxID=88058 RepID=UPI00398096AB